MAAFLCLRSMDPECPTLGVTPKRREKMREKMEKEIRRRKRWRRLWLSRRQGKLRKSGYSCHRPTPAILRQSLNL
eukprot:675204-Hanusia_phi.AAC.20